MGFSNQDSQDEGINDINVTPFVDVVLVLLVIFMVTTPLMVKESLKIELPSSKSSDGGTSQEIGIGINKNNQILLNGELTTVDRLLKFASEMPDKENVTALISADKGSLHGSVVTVIDTIKKAGIEKFAFQIEKILDE